MVVLSGTETECGRSSGRIVLYIYVYIYVCIYICLLTVFRHSVVEAFLTCSPHSQLLMFAFDSDADAVIFELRNLVARRPGKKKEKEKKSS